MASSHSTDLFSYAKEHPTPSFLLWNPANQPCYHPIQEQWDYEKPREQDQEQWNTLAQAYLDLDARGRHVSTMPAYLAYLGQRHASCQLRR